MQEFRCVTATGNFDQVVSFEEQEKSGRIEYTEIRITLHKLIGGNARTTPLPRRAGERTAKCPTAPGAASGRLPAVGPDADQRRTVTA